MPLVIPGSGRMPSIPAGVGVGAIPAALGSLELGPGTYDVAALAVPAGKDLTVYLWGGGGQGGGGEDSGGGGGGGSGGYLALGVPAAVWALGGSLVVGMGGNGGESDQPGNGGAPTTLTLNAITRGIAGEGGGGLQVSPTPTGGAGGTNTTGAGVTVLADADGGAGANGVGTAPGAGGVNPTNASHGSGGAGAPAPAMGGVNGEDGAALIRWS